MSGAAASASTKERGVPARAQVSRDPVAAVRASHPEMTNRPDGAALLAAHFIALLGEEEFATMPFEHLVARVSRFRASYPTVWPAALFGDATSFVMHLSQYGESKMRAEDYQGHAAKLLIAHEERLRPKPIMAPPARAPEA